MGVAHSVGAAPHSGFSADIAPQQAGAIDTCRAQKLVEDRMAAMSIKEEPRDPAPSTEVIAKVNKAGRKFESYGEACKYCGRKDHKIGDRENCPADGEICRKCGRMNHYARVCKAKNDDEYRSARKVKMIEESEDSDDTDYITSIEEVNVVEKKITASVGFAVKRGEAEKKICCQVDTGASCNVIDRASLEKLMGKVAIVPSTTKLRGFDGQIVLAIGKVILRHKSRGRKYKVVFQVVDLGRRVLKMPLLGYKTCMVLGIVSVQDVKVCEFESEKTKSNTVKKYAEVRCEDGKLTEKVKIELEQATLHEPEPMQSSGIPEHPFQIVSMDLGELTHNGKKMIVLVSVDHFSNYFEVDFLSSQRTSELIDRCKKNFSRTGIPRRIITDSAQQFVSQEWMQFMVDYGITHTTSAPYHHESNGKAESAIKTAKNIIKQALVDGKDIWLALLDWRNTPQLDGYTPSQKAMGRRTRSILPATNSQLQLQPVDTQRGQDGIELRKELPKLERGQKVFVQLKPEKTPEWTRGTVTEVLSDKDYQATANEGRYSRNRKYLRDAYSTVKSEESALQESGNRSSVSPNAFYSMSEDSWQPVSSTPKPADRTPNESESSSVQSEAQQSSQQQPPAASPVHKTERPKRTVRRPIRFDDYEVGE